MDISGFCKVDRVSSALMAMHNPEKFESDFLHLWYRLCGGLMAAPYLFAFFCTRNENERHEVCVFGPVLVVPLSIVDCGYIVYYIVAAYEKRRHRRTGGHSVQKAAGIGL